MPIDQALERAIHLHAAGQLAQAEAIYRQILSAQGDHPEALRLLGAIAVQQGRTDEALELLTRAVRAAPESPCAHAKLAEILLAQGRTDDAIASCRTAIALDERCADAYNGLGIALLRLGRCDEAAAAFQKLVELSPSSPHAHVNLCVTLLSPPRSGDDATLAAALDRASRALPRDAQLHHNLAVALFAAGRFDLAEMMAHRTIGIEARHPHAHNILGCTLGSLGRIDEALAALRQAVSLNPDHAGIHTNLLLHLHYVQRPDRAALLAEHRAWAARHASGFAQAAHDNVRDSDRRLRIGYISADFCAHPVGFFIEGVLAAHDRREVEVFCYADVKSPDDVTERLRRHGDHWMESLDWGDDQLAGRIRQDRIDILIDLAGHTAGNRLLVFARRPAPVQVGYLGYPDTTGVPAIGYRIADAWADPPGSEAFFTERLIRLPRTMWCYRPFGRSPDVGLLPALARGGAITLGSFNAIAKVSATTMELWCEVLCAVPAARLKVKAAALSEASVRRRLTDDLIARGIDPARVDLLPRVEPLENHLAAYRDIDIALDTFPYHGTTTTCDALWMGVPVITLAGETHHSRVGVSLLSAVGLGDLIATSPARFVELAAMLARDVTRLAELRLTLRPRMGSSPLTNAKSLAAELEAAYRQMWQRYCALP